MHIDPNVPQKIDSVDFELGGCGYHNSAGQFLPLKAEDGKPPKGREVPSVEVFNAVDFYTLVDSVHRILTDNNLKIINEKRIEYTWHTHPPKINAKSYQQMPSIHDFNFAKSYEPIKQHFLISLKYNWVCYYSMGTKLPMSGNKGESGAFNFKISYDLFFSL